MPNYINDTKLHQYEAGYADGWDDARNGRTEPANTVSPYWDGYHDGATDAKGHYA